MNKILGSSPQAQFLQKLVQQAAITEAPVVKLLGLQRVHY
jgi:hypothetical protein